MSREQVRAVQQWLNDNGFRDHNGNPLQVDGVYGPLTKSAVRSFQSSAGITVDGIWGPQTQGAATGFGNDPNGVTTGVGEGASGTSGDMLSPGLGPELENQFEASEQQIKFDYEQAKEAIELSKTLTANEKERALARLRHDFNTQLKQLKHQRKSTIKQFKFDHRQRARGLREAFGNELKKQPEEFAARGLLRSGLLMTQMGELERDRDRGIRDSKESAKFGINQAKGGFNLGKNLAQSQLNFGTGQLNSQYEDQLKQLQLRLDQLNDQKNFGLAQLGFSKTAKREDIAAALRTIQVPA